MAQVKMKLMVLGYARHGKDSVCQILKDSYGLTFESSSHFVAEKAVRPYLEKKGIVYLSFDEMYTDRVNHRADWFNAIAEYNADNPARLGMELFQQYDIYCGLRRREEFLALKAARVMDYVIWVDASQRLPIEDSSSITITPKDPDWILDNNGPEESLKWKTAIAYNRALEFCGKMGEG